MEKARPTKVEGFQMSLCDLTQICEKLFTETVKFGAFWELTRFIFLLKKVAIAFKL